jgi:pimeloyl-ACP methyl ester carboxylesterase
MSTSAQSSSQPIVIATAHPTDTLSDEAASLLRQAAGAPVICINAHAAPGVSDAPTAQRLEAMVDQIEAERRRRDQGPWIFWGMSGGGWLGLLYARMFPDALTGLILESVCACFRVRLADPSCILSPFNASWKATLDARGLIADGSHDQAGDPDETEWTEVPEVGSVFRRTRGPALLVAPMPIGPEMKHAMPALWSFDARGWLSTLRVPSVVICGGADPVVPPSHARSLSQAIHAELVVIEGAGHVPVTERRPEAAEAVRRFLRDVRAKS